MKIRFAPVLIALLAGCAGWPMGGPAPETGVVPGLAPVDPIQDSAVYAVALAADSTLDAETAAELRAAADSAADAVALEQLANAAPEGDGDTTAGPDAADAVTWDIDVVTYNDHDRVQFYLDFFQTRGRERMGIWLSRLPYYEPMIREELAREGLPGDLVYLALIESGLSNTAVSRARATGMWQFMAGTARMYDLRVDGWVDERRDPYLATNAAARHLSDLRDRFGSLYLAAAAYNAGAGKVSRGIRRLPEGDDEDLLTDATYFRLSDSRYLRRETRDYVPKLIAAAIIAKEPARYGFDPPPVVDPIVWDSIIVPDATGLDVIADLADTTVAAIRALNPKYLRLATPPNTQSVIRVPEGRGETVSVAYADLPESSRVSFLEHRVTRGQTVSGIAVKYGVSISDLRLANPGLRSLIRIGQRLIIPTGGVAAARRGVDVLDRRSAAQVAVKGSYHRVRRGETLSEIARDFGVSTRRLQELNGLGRSTLIKAGQQIRVRGATATARNVGSRKHTVRRGDTLSEIAEKYGVSVSALREANGLHSSAIRAGSKLTIPGA